MELLQLTHCSRLKYHEAGDAFSREEHLRIAASERPDHASIVTAKVTSVNFARMSPPQFLGAPERSGNPSGGPSLYVLRLLTHLLDEELQVDGGASHAERPCLGEIGRASCRERGEGTVGSG